MPGFRWFRRRGHARGSNPAGAEGHHPPAAPQPDLSEAPRPDPPADAAPLVPDPPADAAPLVPDPPADAAPLVPAAAPLVPADPQADFNALVLSVAEDLGWSGTVQDGALHRRAPTADVLGLANLEQLCRQLPRVCWPDVVRSHFEQMDRASRNPVDRSDWITVRPLVRTAVYPDGYFPARVRNEVAARRLTEGLLETVVLDLPESVTVVFQRDLTTWPLDLDQALQAGKAALRNEHRLAPEMITVNEEEVVGLESENLLTATHVCWLDDYLDVTSAGALVALPNRHLVLAHAVRSSHCLAVVAPLARLARRAYDRGPGSLTDQLFWWIDGRLVHLPVSIQGDNVMLQPPAEFVRVLQDLP